MEEFLFHPALWISVIVILIVITIVVIVVSNKRSKEVKELDNLFPEGSLSGENLEKIPVEKVRRTTLERDRRKKKREKELPQKIRPKKGTKVFDDEDQEFIMTNLKQNTQTHQGLRPRKQNTDSYDAQEPTLKYDPSSFQSQTQSTSEIASSSSSFQQTRSQFTRPENKQQPIDDEGGYMSKTDSTDAYSSTSATFSRSKKTYTTQKETPLRSEHKNLSRSHKTSRQNTKYGQSDATEKQPTRSRVSKYSTKKKFF